MVKVTVLFVLLVFSSSSFAEKASCAEEKRDSSIAKLTKQLGKNLHELFTKIDRSILKDPAKQLLPGDIIIYDNDFQKFEGDVGDGKLLDDDIVIEPAKRDSKAGLNIYDHAVGKNGHAGIVAKDSKGKLFILEAPQSEERNREFQGDRGYFVVRPELPQGVTRAEFEKKINDIAGLFTKNKFEYDTFMSPAFRDEKSLKTMKKMLAEHCDGKPVTGKLPAQYCSGLTQTVLTLAGAKQAKGVTMATMLDAAIEKMKKGDDGKPLTQKQLLEVAEKTVRATVSHFVRGDPDQLKQMLETQKDLTKQIAEEKDAEQKKDLEAMLRFVNDEIKENRANYPAFFLAKTLLGTAMKRRILGTKGWPVPYIDSRMNDTVIRPIDILKEGTKTGGKYTYVGVYPGNLPSCDPRRRRPELLPPPREEHD